MKTTKPSTQWVKITDRAGNEFVTAECVQAHSDLSKRFNVPILHNTGQARQKKVKRYITNILTLNLSLLGSSDGEFGVVKYTLKKQTQSAREDKYFHVR